MSAKRKKAIRSFILCLLVLMISPLIILSVISILPSAMSAVFYAANSSAEMNLGSIEFEEKEKVGESTLQEVVESTVQQVDKNIPETDTKQDKVKVFSVDDTMMLSYGFPGIPSSENEDLYIPEREGTPGPEPYPEKIENHDGVIQTVTYEQMTGGTYIELERAGQVRNETDISNETLYEESMKLPDFKIELNGEPQVLIMHTHTTESYEPYERDFFDKTFNSRTTDMSKSVVAVGDRIAYELEKKGIGVIHDTTLHDYPSYNGSYDNSRETVKRILDENPSIKIVLDIHRDAIEREDGERIAPVTEINGKNAAQVMLISGCDDGTMNMPDYMKNFRFASLFQQQMESDYPTLTRPVLFDYRKYNQDLTTGSLLVEVGGHANSIDQAVYSGELIGKSLADALLELADDT